MKAEEKLDQKFWNQRWENAQTGWDIGHASPPLEEYLLQYSNKEAAILIPGCGNAYEAEFLHNQGFQNITVLDISEYATEILRKKFQGKPSIKVITEDFFQHEAKYDLILEQTFFCAINPALRAQYVEKMFDLLKEDGKLAGLLFNRDFNGGPPFGGNQKEYVEIFTLFFEIEKMENAYNSIKARQNTELFVILKKKKNKIRW